MKIEAPVFRKEANKIWREQQGKEQTIKCPASMSGNRDAVKNLLWAVYTANWNSLKLTRRGESDPEEVIFEGRNNFRRTENKDKDKN